jgi:hypothetical protein
MTTITSLDSFLQVLHDRGIVNEDELRAVCCELFDAGEDAAPTRDQLIRIFGQLAIYRAMTTRDETKMQLLKEGIEIVDACLHSRDTPLDLREWVKAARRIVGPTEATSES